MLSSLYAIFLLFLLVSLCGWAGSFGLFLIQRRLFGGDVQALAQTPAMMEGVESRVFSFALTLGAAGMLVWIGGLLGIIGPVLYGILGMGGLFALLTLWIVVRKGIAIPPLRERSTWIGLISGLVFLCTFVVALAPPSGLEWDALSYHLANQKTWLAHGRIDYLPWDHHSNFPFVVQMLYLMMLGAGSVGAAKLVHWLCGVLLVTSVYTFARRHFPGANGATIGAVAALLLATTPVVLWESTVGYVDLGTALFTWLSLYALINSAESTTTASPAQPRAVSLFWLIVSAILMGFALGTKYTVLGFWGILLVGILGWNLAINRIWAKETIPHAALWGAISLSLGLPWYIKNWIVAGNPVYPFAYNIFGGKYWSAENAKQYAEEQAQFGFGKSALDLLLSPWRVTLEIPFFPAYQDATGRPFIFTEYMIFGLSPVFVGLLVALPLLGRRLSRPTVYCLLFGLGVFAFWFLVMQQTRYLIPALPAFAVVIAEAVVLLWCETKALARFGAALLVALSALWGLYLAAGMAFLGLPMAGLDPVWPVVFGQMAPREYVERTLPGLGGACFWINDNTPKDAKVAIFDETRGFYLDREYIWAQPDHAAGLIPWDSYTGVDDWLADFKRKGYTTLLLGKPPEQFPANDNRRWRQLMIEAIQSDKVTLAFAKGKVRVYRIP